MERGDQVLLGGFTDGCIVPDGWHTVSHVNADGSFHVGGNTAVWPHRIVARGAESRAGQHA